jgi:2-oxoglutarate dehydrogenase E2 component (dihydrolipoamide succinyltransferase)
MSIEVKVPSVGESITEVFISEWLKTEGEPVVKDEPIVRIETDKASMDLPSPGSGKMGRRMKREGEQATIGELIAYIEAGDGTATAAAPAAASAKAAPTAANPASPAARQALREHGVAAENVQASGPKGQMLKQDVIRHVENRTIAPAKELDHPGVVSAPPIGAREEEIVPMSPMRRRIAERLVQASQEMALLTTFNEIDMSAVMALRNDFKDAFLERHKVKLGFMSFFVKAAIDALKLVPEINAEIRGSSIVYKNYYDIGVAVGGGRGLVVPVLRDADRMGFAEIEQAIADLAKRAQENKLQLADLEGGTFTISNGGVYGSLLSTPIVNPPQSGVLGLHAIEERPVGRNGAVVLRPMMYVALTYDHRIVDGREAVTFLKRIKHCVENPSRMLLEV